MKSRMYKLKKLLDKYDLTFNDYIQLIDTEDLTDDELNDFDYLEDKFSILKEMLKEQYTQENIFELLISSKDNIKRIGDYCIKNQISLSELKWENYSHFAEDFDSHISFDNSLLEVADYILGIYYDTI